MIQHKNIIEGTAIPIRRLLHLIKDGQITLGGNAKLKIYGRLQCKSGKRMKPENRVFFKNEEEAIELGYRPCGNCYRRKRTM